MAADEPATFAGLLKRLRTGAGLSQRELAEAAGLSFRTISDLERGVATNPQKDTIRLLADALHLISAERARFEAVARGRELAAHPAATRTLPRDIAWFTGRERELGQLMDAALKARSPVGIHTIGGMAGVGKTTLAVRAAHQLADRFPGGQIFLQLHGHTPGRKPADPEDALASLLLIIGIAADQVPPGLEARSALWRDRLAGQRLLLVLDDAVSSEQIDPLLPGAGESFVLVTSRRHLSALDDATSVSLDTLPPDEAARLLVRLTARPGLNRADPVVAELAGLCGFLPLAIGLIARQLRHHPAWSLARRAAELAAARDRLELMATENVSVAAAFDLSYAGLDPDLQQLFRRLGLHPGSDFDAYAAAALDGSDLAAARRGLEGLYDHYLLTEPAQGRYRMHDLIREHARTIGGRLDPGRDVVLARMLDYYQDAAARAHTLISRRTIPRSEVDPASDSAVPDLTDSEQALTWMRTERANLTACLEHAAETGQQARVIALTAALGGLLHVDGPWTDAIPLHRAAATAARLLNDRLGEANTLVALGDVLQQTGDYAAALQVLEMALDQYRRLGNRLGEANALCELAMTKYVTDDYPGAADLLAKAEGIYSEIGERLGRANAFRSLGAVTHLMGDYPAAIRLQEQALDIYRDLGNRQGQAGALNYLGTVRGLINDYQAAAQAQQEAMVIFRDLGNIRGEANALSQLATVQMDTADYPGAAASLREAVRLYAEIGYRLGHAGALNSLGLVLAMTGDFAGATAAEQQSLGLYRDLGSRLGEANALRDLGVVRRMTSAYAAATQLQDQALAIYGEVGSRLGTAWALTELITLRRLTGDLVAALRDVDRTVAIYRDLGERMGEAQVLNEAGTAHRLNGDLTQARRCHQQAFKLASAIAAPLEEAQALAGLGRCAVAAEDPAQGERLLRQALEIFERIGVVDAPALRAELEALGSLRG